MRTQYNLRNIHAHSSIVVAHSSDIVVASFDPKVLRKEGTVDANVAMKRTKRPRYN